MLSEDRAMDKLIAEKVFGYEVEIVKPDWYPFEVYLFKWPERGVYAYSLDEDACNALMYRNGVDEKDGFLPPLPFYSSADEADFVSIHEPMLARHGAEIRYFIYSSCWKVIYGVDITRPSKIYRPITQRLAERCFAESEDMAWALCSAVKKFFEIEEAERKEAAK